MTVDYGKLNQIAVSTAATMSDTVSLLGETNTALGTWYEASDLARGIKVVCILVGQIMVSFTFLAQSYVNSPTLSDNLKVPGKSA